MKAVQRCLLTSMILSLPVTVFAGVPACISKHYPQTTLTEDAIKLNAPDIAENGAVVGVGKEVSFFNEFRDGPVARFELANQINADSIKTRVRLRQSSNLYAVAKLSDGQVLTGKRFIKVTIGGVWRW